MAMFTSLRNQSIDLQFSILENMLTGVWGQTFKGLSPNFASNIKQIN